MYCGTGDVFGAGRRGSGRREEEENGLSGAGVATLIMKYEVQAIHYYIAIYFWD
jgi:hypothetical protein